MNNIIQSLGLISGILMPLWNIPLIVRIIRRKSSHDISLAWVIGVWVCIVLMFPASLQSADLAFKAYGLVNTIFFTAVMVTVVYYRKKS